jgi:hypothetical protein
MQTHPAVHRAATALVNALLNQKTATSEIVSLCLICTWAAASVALPFQHSKVADRHQGSTPSRETKAGIRDSELPPMSRDMGCSVIMHFDKAIMASYCWYQSVGLTSQHFARKQLGEMDGNGMYLPTPSFQHLCKSSPLRVCHNSHLCPCRLWPRSPGLEEHLCWKGTCKRSCAATTSWADPKIHTIPKSWHVASSAWAKPVKQALSYIKC